MNSMTLRIWKRDALETLHNNKHDKTDLGGDARKQANRVILLIEQVLPHLLKEEEVSKNAKKALRNAKT